MGTNESSAIEALLSLKDKNNNLLIPTILKKSQSWHNNSSEINNSRNMIKSYISNSLIEKKCPFDIYNLSSKLEKTLYYQSKT